LDDVIIFFVETKSINQSINPLIRRKKKTIN